ncbi:MAG TPA: dTDP-4-dehydrorhamnose 3,5-epimerase [Terriglobales bacterium]|nr:dTDP-4-dehydrorhamnose 3,5-epimerase [Terriglobales bacterium]
MKSTPTSLPGVLVLEPKVFSDERGFFLESYNEKVFADLGIRERFVQDNQSFSKQGVVRGLHYQAVHPQGKLMRAVSGEIFDVAVDLRKSSPTFGQWHGEILSAENKRMLWIPVGFAHGFSVLSPGAQVLYKTTDFYHPESERTILWNDAQLRIDWRLKGEPTVSAKDLIGVALRDAEIFE